MEDNGIGIGRRWTHERHCRKPCLSLQVPIGQVQRQRHQDLALACAAARQADAKELPNRVAQARVTDSCRLCRLSRVTDSCRLLTQSCHPSIFCRCIWHFKCLKAMRLDAHVTSVSQAIRPTSHERQAAEASEVGPHLISHRYTYSAIPVACHKVYLLCDMQP